METTKKEAMKKKLKNVFWATTAVIIVFAVLPMPTRCRVENRAYYGGNPGILPPGVVRPPDSPTHHAIARDCYTPNRVEFWKNPEWSFEFHWLFIQRLDLLIGYRPDYITIHLSYPADLLSENILLGASHNVFIGKVLAQTGNKETEIGPRTQYEVQVISNIKGDLTDIVTVDILGGYDSEGKLVLVESDNLAPEDALFQPGSTYLFATRYNAQEDWYTVIAHPNARKMLSKDASLAVQALKALGEQDEKVKKFEAVYVSEVPDKADVANNNTRNSFQSLPPEAKAAAQARADEARVWLETIQ